MSVGKSKLSIQIIITDMIVFFLFLIGWMFIITYPIVIPITLLVQNIPIGWWIIILIGSLILLGFFIKWFGRGIMDKKIKRTMFLGVLILLVGIFQMLFIILVLQGDRAEILSIIMFFKQSILLVSSGILLFFISYKWRANK